MDVLPAAIAVTGVSGLLAQRLLPHVDALEGVTRVVGLDVREPARRIPRFEFHRVDIASSDLTPILRGVDTIVHLAGVDPSDVALLAHVNLEGTRRVLEAAGAVGVRRIVRTSSAAVYGAWANNPVPITEDAVIRPNPGYQPALHDAENERRLLEWRSDRAGTIATTLRLAPVVGPGAHGLLARAALGRPPVSVRGAARPVQVVHVDDAATALAIAVAGDLDGTYNVAADGWLSEAAARELGGHRAVPALPAGAASRLLRALWSSGLGEAPPGLLPYLVHPWVIANDRLRAEGWVPRYTNEAAVSASLPLAPALTGRGRVAVAAGVVAVSIGSAAGAVAVSRRRRATHSRR